MFSKDNEGSRFLSNDGNFLPDLIVPYSTTGMHKFSKNLRSHLKIVGARRVIKKQFHTED
jgi:hypothetical protein